MVNSGIGQEWQFLLRKFIQEQEQRNEAINRLILILKEKQASEGSDVLSELIEQQEDNIKFLDIFKGLLDHP